MESIIGVKRNQYGLLLRRVENCLFFKIYLRYLGDNKVSFTRTARVGKNIARRNGIGG